MARTINNKGWEVTLPSFYKGDYMILAATAVSMAITGAMAAKSGEARARAQRANNLARYKQLANQFNLESQNMSNNSLDIRQQKLANDVLIQESKLDAEDRFASAFAGSGVSGRSIDNIELQIQSDVNKAHIQNKRQADQATDREFLGLMRKADRYKAEVENTLIIDADAETMNQQMAMIGAGIQAGASAYAGGKSWF